MIDEAAGGVGPELPQRRLDVVARDVEVGHLRQIERHPVLAYLAADRDDLGNAGDGEQARADHPVARGAAGVDGGPEGPRRTSGGGGGSE
jgi:hypothetical protein